MASQTTDTDWAITPKDKMQFDGVFASLDKVGRGFITGEEAVGFFGNSKLPEDILAQIWDLADINAEGRLNRDEFAVAMHLIRQQRGSQTDRGSLPVTLPANLIPPSMRHQGRPNLQTAAPAFEIAAQPTAKSATEDLFGLDAFSSASTTQSSPVASKSSVTGNINLPSSPSSVAHVTPFKPFIPSSSFGQNMITANTTGSSTPSGAGVARYDQQASRSAAEDDLLGDNDPEVSKKLTAETSELANLSNQVGTLSNQMREVKARRASRNQDLSDAATQKRDFEARLSQLRALYEQEVKEVTQLEYRLNVSRGETRQLQQDMAIIQRTYADLQSQHQQVIAALESDRQENASLKERMRVLNNETSQLRPQLEKIKSDARQQKGLVAINRKQLDTNEADHEKVRNEIREATRVVEEAPQSARSVQVPIAPVLNASSPVTNPMITSPTNQSMNPFFRRSSNTPGDYGARSPYLSGPSTSDSQAQPGASPFDNVFGPPFALPRQLSSPYDAPEHDPVIHHQADTSGPSVRSSEGTEIATPPSSAPASTKRDSPQPIEPPIIIQSRPSTTTLLASREAPHEDVPVTGLHTAGSTSRDHSRDSSNASGGGEGGAMIPSSMLTAHAIEPSLSGSSAKDTTRRPDALASEKSDSFKSFKADDIPGAFPEEVMPGSQQPTPTGNSAFKEVSIDHKRSLTQHAQVSQGDSNTLGTERSPQSVGAQDDFEAAFANMGPAKMHQARSNTGDSASSIGVAEGQRFNKEFPPIEEFGADEESDSQDEHGFDDNFTSSSSRKGVTILGGVQHATSPQPPTPFGNEAARTQEPSGALSAAVRSSTNPMSQSEVDPSPTAGKQRPPPTYNGTAEPLPVNAVLPGLSGGHNLLSSSSTEHGRLQAEPQSLSKSPPPPLNNAQMAMSPFDTFHSAASTPIVDSSNVGTGSQAPQHSLFRDDFDDAFADLDDAKEADDKSEVDLASSTLQMDNLDEFNPVFDSPAPSHYHAIRSLLPTSPGSPMRPANASSDFEPHLGAASEDLSPSATGGSHDWDAIFAGLGTSGAPNMTGAAQLPGVPPKEPVRYPIGLGQAPSPFDGPLGLISHSATSDGIDASTAQRPMVGRALTGGSEHDDPILKKLTGMGYPRNAALDALERYDYNITKVSNPRGPDYRRVTD